MKIEEGKYYRTADGRKVGPAIRLNPDRAFDDLCWARFHSGGDIFEISGVEPEDAFDTRLVSEWVDDDQDTPKRWKDLTPEEKGALLLAHHEGEVIEVRAQDSDNWYKRDSPNWADEGIFRVKPARETVTLYGDTFYDFSDFEGYPDFKITFDLVDGEPDTDSIRMEKL